MKYLEFIFKSVPKEMASEFVYLASIVWEKHSVNRDIQMSEIQISENAKNLAEEEYKNLF